jgi:transposase-like protein
MPWTESDAMDQRLQFVTDALSDRFTMTELCERYGVSSRIDYKWLARFNEDGQRGLGNRSRRPHTCPTQIRPVLAELLCEFRRLHLDWGAQAAQGAARPPSRDRRLARREHGGGLARPARARTAPTASTPPSAPRGGAPRDQCA